MNPVYMRAPSLPLTGRVGGESRRGGVIMRVKMKKAPHPALPPDQVRGPGHPPRKGAGWVLVEAIVNPGSGPCIEAQHQPVRLPPP